MSILQAFVMPHPPLAVPAVGQGREREIDKTVKSFQKAAARIAELRPDTLIIISPHSTMYSDYIHVSPGKAASGSLRQFGAPEVTEARYDAELTEALEAICESDNLAAGTLGEREPGLDHGVLVPLYFINQVYSGYRLVRVAPSGLPREDHYRFGMLLAETADCLKRRAVLIASGDLSHKLTVDGPYGYAPEGPELDRRLTGIFASGEFGELFDIGDRLREKGAECGYLPAVVLAGALDKKAVLPELYSYEGPFGVGYAVASFTVAGDDPGRDFYVRRRKKIEERIAGVRAGEDPFVRLARETLEAHVRGDRLPSAPERAEMTGARAGVFVSIKKYGQLRGCIGTTGPTKPDIAREIQSNAVAAGTRDPRFPPVEPAELGALTYSVDVLFPPEPCDEAMLDPEKYGVIVTSRNKRGLLLPNLEGVETVSEQVAIAKAKAGIRDGELCGFERFRVVRHE